MAVLRVWGLASLRAWSLGMGTVPLCAKRTHFVMLCCELSINQLYSQFIKLYTQSYVVMSKLCDNIT